MSSGPPTTIKLNSDGTMITWDTSTPTGLELGYMAGTDTRILTLDMTTTGDTLVVTWGIIMEMLHTRK